MEENFDYTNPTISMMLNPDIQNLIRDHAQASIDRKSLTPELLTLIYKQNWFNLWVPKVYGGLDADLKEGCRLLEELAYLDGGVGWTVTLCAGANMFAGFLDPVIAGHIFQSDKVCWGGSGQVSGRADKVADHFILTGFWKYATGAPHLTHFTLNAWIYENGQPVLDVAGEPLYHSFFVDREDVLIHYDWDTFGLACTASHSFSVDALTVDAERAFDLRPDKRTHNSPVFFYPFLTFAECTLAVNYVGMFRRFLDLLEKQLLVRATSPAWDTTKGKAQFKKVDQVRTVLEEKRERLYRLIDETWDKELPDQSLLDDIASLTRGLAHDIRTETAALFPFTGIAGAQLKHELNIVFRHLFTASQHGLLNN